MAFFDPSQLEDEESPNQGAAGEQTGPSGGLIGGGSSGGSPSAPAAAGAPDKPGNFVGLKQYLDANRAQAQKLGNQVAGNLNQTVDDAKGAVGGVQGQFDEKVKGGQIGNFESALDEGKGLINQAATQGKVTNEGKQRFGEIANAQYGGPKTLSEASDIYQPVSQKVQGAQNKANLTTSEEGKQELLRGMTKAPNYTSGAQRFDAYLLNDPNSRAKLDQARTSASALSGQLSQEEQVAAQKAQAAQAQAKSLQDQIRAAFGRFDDPTTQDNEATGALGDYQNEIMKQVAEAKQYGDALTGRVNEDKITLEDLEKMGLQNMATYGIDFKNFYQPGIATAAGVTDQQERARYDALRELGGVDTGIYGGATNDEFGSYKPTANIDAFTKAVTDQKNLYEITQAKQRAADMVNYLRYGRPNMSIVGGGPWDNLLRGISEAQNADQVIAAKKAFDDYNDSVGIYRDYYQPQKDLTNYLNNVLMPARADMLVGNMPAMPKNPDGSIDWSQIQPPTGSAGKYQDMPEEDDDDFLPAKG